MIVGPLLFGAGVAFGSLDPGAGIDDAARAAAQTGSSRARTPSTSSATRPSSAGTESAAPVAGTPGFAGIVAAARDGVVGVRTIHRPAVGAPDATHDEGLSRGTGFLLHSGGIVVTAHHVVADPHSIIVELPGFGPRQAELIGEDPPTDVAVLRILDPPEDLPSLQLGRSEDVQQGDWVVTIGNPLRLRQTVGAGVVGFVGRHLDADEYGITNEHLQFGAPAYPGSSGSPVLDMQGTVVGMTTRSAVGGDGFAFAVTARVIRNVLASMARNSGRVRRAFLGAGVELVHGGPRLGQHPCAEGLAVELTAVLEGRAADRAGLRCGDVIVRVGGQPIESLGDFYDTLTWAEPGSAVELLVARGFDPPRPITVELGELDRLPSDLTQ